MADAPAAAAQVQAQGDRAVEAGPAEFIPFEEFRNGLAYGRFHVIVNPALAPKFVSNRVHAVPLALALIGPGIVAALSGYAIVGGVLIAAGMLLRRMLKKHAPRILLHLTTTQPELYRDAAAQGVMEVRRA